MNAIKPKIPNFSIIELCGRGGSSEVWLGIDDDGIKRAIRIMDKVNEETSQRIEAESKAIALYRNVANQHVNLLEILYIGKTSKYLYYVTELADNVAQFSNKYEPDTLAWRIQNLSCSPEEIVEYIEAILNGVEQLHAHHIAHHDLKPENIIFVKKILKVADPGLIASSQETLRAGTSGFHPPWNATGIEADIYAIGKIIYCLFTKEDATKFPEIPDTLEINPLASLNEIALRCCESDPGVRYKSIQEIRKDIEKLKKPSSFRVGWTKAKEHGFVILAVLLGISVFLNLYSFWGRLFEEKLSDDDAMRTLQFTYQNINSMTLTEIDQNLSLLKNCRQSFLQNPDVRFLHTQLNDYANWIRYHNTENNSIFALPLIANLSLFDSDEKQLILLKRFITLNPDVMNSSYSLYHYYLFCKKKKDEKQAAKLLAKLKSADFSKYNQYEAAYELLQLSNDLAEIGNYEDSLFFALKAQELTPNNVAVFVPLFQAYYKLEKYDDALAALRKLHSLRPQSTCVDYFYHLLVEKGLQFSLD